MIHPKDLRIEDFTYTLPDERIARYPLSVRDTSKLLLYEQGLINEYIFNELPQHIPAKSMLVFNEAKVVNARLLLHKKSGGRIELFCLAPHAQYADITSAMSSQGSVLWECLVGGAAKWKNEESILAECEDVTLSATIAERRQGSFTIALSWSNKALSFAEILHLFGKVPLPPYLKRAAEKGDENTYQTVYARAEGSVAAPTAGLHFTQTVLQTLAEKGVAEEFVTLHVGAGTFVPVKSEQMSGHDMHAEWIDVNTSFIEKLAANVGTTKVIAVGTTSMRTLESLYWIGNALLNDTYTADAPIAVGQWTPYDTEAQHTPVEALDALTSYLRKQGRERLLTRTQIMIAPGYKMRIVDGLITNFHQPQSTLLLLVSALIGDDWRKVYQYALDHKFRFLSYGDSSLLWRKDNSS
jgi:S-adenosylmethionine:tRNA ribosyltransferase-isomerase